MLESFRNNVFTYKKLTEDEQKTRGILGRLVGIIADTKNPTRNGRTYSKDLWENVFNDPVMLEKIENRCCFGELGHPADREEVDPEKIAICLAEKPKVGDDGKLYGVFDIVNTPCGKILKALCDYGANIGVSSRGSGDIDVNNDVDPNTYYCECWDAVVVPAVKEARPKYVTESLDHKNIALRTALQESLNSGDAKQKAAVEEVLKDLNIELTDTSVKLNESVEEKLIDNQEFESLKESFSKEEFDRFMTAAKKLHIITMGDLEKFAKEHNDAHDQDLLAAMEKEAEGVKESLNEEERLPDDEIPFEDPEDGNILEEDADEEETSAEADEESSDVSMTVGDLKKELNDYDDDLELTFNPIVIDGNEYSVENMSLEDSEDGKVVIDIGYSQEIGDNIEEEDPEAEQGESEEDVSEVEDKEEETVSDAVEESDVIESMKEMIGQKDKLEGELKALKSEKTVSDAKAEELKEEVERYKSAFIRVGQLAAKVPSLTKKVNELNESISEKDIQIEKLQESHKSELNEGLDKSKSEIKLLKENLLAKNEEAKQNEQKYAAQVTAYKGKLEESVKVVESYKAKCQEAFDAYVSFRAQLLGVKPAEITRRLDENYSVTDIDKACDEIIEGSAMSSMPFGFGEIKKVKINENKEPAKKAVEDDLTSLYELAGLMD